MHGHYFRKRDFVSDSIKLVSDFLMKLWYSVVYSDEELSTTYTSTATGEDAKYEEYRDELDDFVTIET